MALTAGAITIGAISAGVINASATAASGGTGPYTQQWYADTTSGFTPGAGNIVPGATALSVAFKPVLPNSTYYLKVVYTDTGAGNAQITSTQATAVSAANSGTSPNQFGQSMVAGVVDPRMAPNTVSVIIDPNLSTPIYPGCAVKALDVVSNGPLVVTPCTASSDDVIGFLNYDTIHSAFVAGDRAEMSGVGNGIYLWATGAIGAGKSVQLDVTTQGGVKQVVGASGAAVVGWAFGKTTGPGLIRIILGQAVGVLKA